MTFGRFAGLAAVAATMMVMTFPAAAQFVADDSLAGISRKHLALILQKVSAEFEQPERTLFAGLRPVKRGYCGYVNSSLDYDGFVPFFFDSASFQVEIGSRGNRPDTPTTAVPQGCR